MCHLFTFVSEKVLSEVVGWKVRRSREETCERLLQLSGGERRGLRQSTTWRGRAGQEEISELSNGAKP